MAKRVARRTLRKKPKGMSCTSLAAEQSLHDLVESLHAIVWEADPTTWQFSFVSQHAEVILGYPITQWLTEPHFWANHVHPEDREQAVAYCQKATAEGRDHEFGYRAMAADGRVVWIHDIVRVVKDAQGRVVRLRGVMVEITESKEAEAQLRKRARQQVVISHLGELALRPIDLSELFDEVVLLVAQTLGVEYSKILELLPDDKALLLRAGIGWKEGLVSHTTVGAETASQAGYTLLSYEPVIVEDLSRETRFRAPALLQEHGVVSGISVFIPGRDRAYGVLGAHSIRRRKYTDDDVHFMQSVANFLAAAIERNRAEKALRQSEEKFRLLFEDSRDAICITMQQGAIVDANRAALDLFGYTREEMMALSARQLYANPDDRRQYQQEIERLGAVTDYEIKLNKKDGTELDCLLASTLWRGLDGKILGYQSIIRDITERKKAETELKRSQQQLRALAAHLQTVREDERTRIAREIHDELGQALTALKMDLSWIRRKLDGGDAVQEKTTSMLDLVDRTIQMVRRISSELRPGILDDLGLTAAIEWQLQELNDRAGSRYALSSSLEDISLDQARSTALFRIFQEAMTNIVRHSNATRVEVGLEQNADHVTLEIMDNGKGIEEDKISDPKSLGLIGMRERALLLGGDVSIRGKKGQGTTVTVRIPRDESATSGAAS